MYTLREEATGGVEPSASFSLVPFVVAIDLNTDLPRQGSNLALVAI